MPEITRHTKEILMKILSAISDFSVAVLFYIHFRAGDCTPYICIFTATICILHGLFYLFNAAFCNDFLLIPLKVAKFSASVLSAAFIFGGVYTKNTLCITAFSICLVSYLLFDARPRLHIAHCGIAMIPSLLLTAFPMLKYYGIYTINLQLLTTNFSNPKDLCIFLVSSFGYTILIFIINGRLLNPVFSLLRLVFKRKRRT